MYEKLLSENFPDELKNMSERELGLLCYEIRDFLIEKISKTGGHLASNLGVVELTVALHRVFNSPIDKIIWDVGHQTYVHKILTGRGDQFDTLRMLDGLSGFPKRKESMHDTYDAGHSSTSISAALGYAAARDIKGENHDVVAVIGDGALTGGVAYEALNNVGNSKSKMIVVLNDNEMSIAENTGGISQHLGRLRTSQGYLDFKRQVKKTLKGIPGVGEGLYAGIEHIRDSVKYAVVKGAIFEEFGLKYFGPVDGHNIHDLIETLTLARYVDEPVLIHVVTKKGKGYLNAEKNPEKFHGVGVFDPTTGRSLKESGNVSYSQIFGNKMVQLASRDEKIAVVGAAMLDAAGLNKFQSRFPDRTFDVGIAEQHAVSFAAGLALSGLKPVVAIYSTFLQRSYDQILIEVCLQNLPVIFAVDRSGNVGNDGETHHGQFDLSYLTHMPNMTVLAPKDGKELAEMLEYALNLQGPCAIRYPRGDAADLPSTGTAGFNGKGELLEAGSDVTLLAAGKMVEYALEASDILSRMGYSADVINARSIKPLDRELILASAEKTRKIVTIEDNSLAGGLGAGVSCLLDAEGFHGTEVLHIGWPDQFIEAGAANLLLERYKLDTAGIVERVRKFLERKA